MFLKSDVLYLQENVEHVLDLMDPDGDGVFNWSEFFRAGRLRRR
jgi:Ca2+-binding EF-hand superfamily protein